MHTCALFGTGVSSCWGANVNGQIGIGVIGGPSYVPVATIYPTATSTMIASNLNPSVFGDNVTFTATVTGGVNGVPVAFQVAGVNIAGAGRRRLQAGLRHARRARWVAGRNRLPRFIREMRRRWRVRRRDCRRWSIRRLRRLRLMRWPTRLLATQRSQFLRLRRRDWQFHSVRQRWRSVRLAVQR